MIHHKEYTRGTCISLPEGFISLNQEAESLPCVLIGYCQPTIHCSLRGPLHSLLRIHRQPAFLLPSPIYDFITARSSSQNFNCVQHKDLQICGIDKSSIATGKEGDSTSHLCHLTQPSRFYTWYFFGCSDAGPAADVELPPSGLPMTTTSVCSCLKVFIWRQNQWCDDLDLPLPLPATRSNQGKQSSLWSWTLQGPRPCSWSECWWHPWMQHRSTWKKGQVDFFSALACLVESDEPIYCSGWQRCSFLSTNGLASAPLLLAPWSWSRPH